MSKANVNGVELYYEILGEGEPVAFLNGVLMTVKSWAGEIDFLQTKYQCIMHDCRGQLLSEKPEGDYSMELHAEDFKTLLDYLNIERCHVVGTSYGGEIGMIFAYTYPGRVKSLTVISSVSEIDRVLYHHTQTSATAAMTDPDTFVTQLYGMVYGESFLKQQEDYLAQRREAIKQLPQEFFTGFTRLIKAFHKLDITERVSRIQCPTLLICGENDILKTPRHHKIMAEAIPNSELLTVYNAGHAITVEKPELISTLLYGFIERHR